MAHWETQEPKFSNNAGTKTIRPKTRSEVENLFFSTSYTDTLTNIHIMEGAVEAGKRATNAILKKGGISHQLPIYAVGRTMAYFLAPIRSIDYALFTLGLPAASDFIGGHALGFFVLYSLSLLLICVLLTRTVLRHLLGSRKLKTE